MVAPHYVSQTPGRAVLTSLKPTMHPAQTDLLRLSQEEPGLNIHEIAQRIKLSRGATRYHLRALIRSSRITTQRQGHHLLHFAASMPEMQRRGVALLRIPSVRSIVEALVQSPSLQSSALARQLGFSARSVRRGIKMLIRHGLARQEAAEGARRRIQLHPDVRIAWVLWCKDAVRDATPAPIPTAASAWMVSLESLMVYVVAHWIV